jgi:DNA-binding response OmpR family regulator
MLHTFNSFAVQKRGIPMMKTISLLSESVLGNGILKDAIENGFGDELSSFETKSILLNDLREEFDPSCSAAILNLRHWTTYDIQHIIRLRASGFTGQILILAKRSQEEEIQFGMDFENAHFLVKPYEDEQLVETIKHLLFTTAAKRRIFRRYDTHKMAELQIADYESSYCTVKNISRGGALLTFDEEPQVRRGDIVSVGMSLGHRERLQTLNARVARIQDQNVGVEFLRAAI